MALTMAVVRQRFFSRSFDYILRNQVVSSTVCSSIQCRYVQSQRDAWKDSRVPVPGSGLLEKFENKFQRKYPKLFRVYALFKKGTKDFISDGKQFYRITMRIRSGEPLHKFSRGELELLLQLPPQAAKVIPMIIISILPFGFYLVIPLAYFFPRQLLCRHFWTPEQRVQFAMLDVKRRMPFYDAVLEHLQRSSDRLAEKDKKTLASVLDKVNLSRSVKLSIWRKRLHKSCTILLAADKALSRESIDLLSEAELRQACATRGLNPVDLGKKEMTNYLKTWLGISLKLKETDASLLLHAPTLLARNHPNNVRLRK